MTNKEPFKSPKSHRFTSENASEYGRLGAMKRKEFYQIQKQIRCLASFLMLQKIDSKGRIFYVDTINKKTSFTHPLSSNKYTPNSINQYENEQFEPIYYRSENNSKIRIVYVDHENKTTSWVDPHRCNKFNYFPNIKE